MCTAKAFLFIAQLKQIYSHHANAKENLLRAVPVSLSPCCEALWRGTDVCPVPLERSKNRLLLVFFVLKKCLLNASGRDSHVLGDLQK